MSTLDRTPPHPVGRYSPDPERSYTLPASYYTDAALFEREKREIFHRSWNFGCHLNQVREPGSYATVDVAGQNILIMRSLAGELGAFYNVCSHRAHELLTGCGKATMITNVGDPSCCGADNALPYGTAWRIEPFICTSETKGLTCARDDGHGFFISKAKTKVY